LSSNQTGNSRGKAIRKGGKRVTKSKSEDISDETIGPVPKNLTAEDVSPVTSNSIDTMGTFESNSSVSKRSNESQNLDHVDKKPKVEPISTVSSDCVKVEDQPDSVNSNFEAVAVSSSDSVSQENSKEKLPPRQFGYVNTNTNLIPSMSLSSIEQHLSSLECYSNLTPKVITDKCLPIIQKLIDDPYGWVFRDPVDPLELDIPDYFDVIKEPMELSRIKKRLENGVYKNISTFERETKLVFDNSILYNGAKSDVGDMAKTLKAFFEKQLKITMKGIKAEKQLQMKTGDFCTLCGSMNRMLEPTTIYCTASCGGQAIRRDAVYYTDQFRLNNWCTSCYNLLDNVTPIVVVDHYSIYKEDLSKMKNDEEAEEAWIRCDDCNSWMHQICALASGRKTSSTFTCPSCHVKQRKNSSDNPEKPLERMNGARQLPSCALSDSLECGLKKRLENAYVEKAERLGCKIEDIERVEGLCIRVVSDIEKTHFVGKGMLERYGKRGYPKEFKYKSKCIVLFQTIHGVDVMLFVMFVHEYGDTCPLPNRRRVYISYIDSVDYFRPRQYRSITYHSIIIEYLKFVKMRGFHTAHIWSCPPFDGNDYIFYCHPENQRIPRADMLCAWYNKMLSNAKTDNVVLSVNTFYDEYFKNDSFAISNPDNPSCLPYFEGDYIPGELENIIKDVKTLEKTKNNGDLSSLDLLNQTSDQVMLKLSQAMVNMKQHFIVAHLHSRKFALAVDRGEDITKLIEEDDELLNQGFGKDASILRAGSKLTKATGEFGDINSLTITTDLEKSMLSDSCANGVKLKNDLSSLALCQDKLEDINASSVVNIVAKDEFKINFFQSRQQLLNFCQVNYLQFDDLRRAKHSSMIILYNLHNPNTFKFPHNCGGESLKMSDEEYKKNIKVHLELVMHTPHCEGFTVCNSSNCQRMQLLLNHLKTCELTYKKGCRACTRFFSLIQFHSRECNVIGTCSMPFCDMLRKRNERWRDNQNLLDNRRRIAQNELHRSAGVNSNTTAGISDS